MIQTPPVSATSSVERFRGGAGRRALGIGLALLIEALLLLALLSLGVVDRPGEKNGDMVKVTLVPNQAAEEAAEPAPEPAQPAEQRPAEQQPQPDEPLPPTPVEPKPSPIPPPIVPPLPQQPTTAIPAPPSQPPAPRKMYGPPDRGGSAAMRDSQVVGTAPNGEPLYAAAWYREPRPDQLRAYLSTANGPGWGLIACRTAPDWRVEDCVALEEYPYGSQINRAVLAAAWEFKVRPPRLGGKSLVGSWVRIRIDYGIGRK